MVIKPVVLTHLQIIELIDVEFKAAHLAHIVNEIGMSKDTISIVKDNDLLRIVFAALDIPKNKWKKAEDKFLGNVSSYGYHPEMSASDYLEWLLAQLG